MSRAGELCCLVILFLTLPRLQRPLLLPRPFGHRYGRTALRAEAARDHYNLPANLWQAFTAVAGDPGEDLRLLAVLPPTVVSAALERSQLDDGSYLSAVQASHVGLVYNLARRIQHTKGGGDWDSWKESSPFGTTSNVVEPTVTQATSGSTSERKLKLSQVLDQADDGEFVVQTEEARAGWYQQHLSVVGGWPLEEEEPTLEQMSALQRCLQVQDVAPYADFAIYVPFGQRALRASKWRTFVATPDGYTARELPGPSNFTLWRTCYRLLRTSLIMLDAVGLAALHSYEMHLERLARLTHLPGTYCTLPTKLHVQHSRTESGPESCWM
eukprot:s3866_g5.t1